jgi:hypothetical protein
MPGSLAGSQLKSSPLTHSAPWPAAHAPKLPGWVRQERRFSVGSVILGAGGKNLFGHLVTHPPVPNRGGVSGKKVSIRTHSSDGRRLLPKSDPPTPAGVWGACQTGFTSLPAVERERTVQDFPERKRTQIQVSHTNLRNERVSALLSRYCSKGTKKTREGGGRGSVTPLHRRGRSKGIAPKRGL